MDPLTMSLLVGIPAAVKTGTGIAQYLQGRKALRNTKRPMREIPREVIANLNQAQVQALEGMPEEQRNLFIQDMQRGQQQAVRGLSDRRAGIAGIPQLYQGELDSLNRLAMQDSAMRLQNQNLLTAQRAEMGRQRDTQFQLNEYEPFLNKMRMAEGLIGSGMQNAMGGITDASKMLMDYSMLDEYNGGDGLNVRDLFKKKQTPVNGFDSVIRQQINKDLIRQDSQGNISNGMMLPPYSTNPYTGITG
jgi:hypothetical protein